MAKPKMEEQLRLDGAAEGVGPALRKQRVFGIRWTVRDDSS